ncbi:ATPase family AAA domain-containing protein 5 [Anomaloglossus baeobatrachus]|uniref:ATPase family AAA domain-containing protein 5 n=1 Tax=Anomaloglossus baeobatrachus TaxID=238106 RepID=UPI003F5066A1
MVGVLAVSPALEDLTAQSGKKQRRDEDPASKTITNYFSPLSKSIDRGLSSPKNSNIADYFIRCSPAASRERTPKMTSSPVCGAKSRESPSSPLTGSPRPAGRMAKRGKRSRLVRRLSDLAPASNTEAADSGGRKPSNSGIMGSDTAALLAEICSQTGNLGDDDNDVVFQSETFSADGATRTRRRQILKRSKVVAEEKKGERLTTDPKDHRSLMTSTTSSESRTSVLDSSLEVLQDNSSPDRHTLTIPYEEFMKIQGGNDESSPADPSGLINAVSGNSEQLPSPNTVTIQAQVHHSPPLQLLNSAKIASIFKKTRVDKKKVDTPKADQIGPVTSKRKSNVVILEDDLELDIIDVEAGESTKQRSTQAERQQFMKAFRQAGEPSRTNTKKNPGKKKELSEGTENPPKLEAEEQVSEKSATKSKSEEPDKAQKLKMRRKPPSTPRNAGSPRSSKEQPPDKPKQPEKVQRLQRKKTPSAQIGTGTPSSSKEQPPDKSLEPEKVRRLQRKTKGTPRSSNPAAADERLPADEAQEVDKASTLSSETPNTAEEQTSLVLHSPVLRRSLRRQTGNPSSRSPERTESPILMSTPKVQSPCRNADIYKAEVLTVPSDIESPIRMRFTRVTRRRSSLRTGHIGEVSVPVPQSSKKMRKVKQILEKAKAIQQSLARAETPQRRSARQKTRVLQDFSIITDLTKSRKTEEKTRNLRSLNDVLGKKVKEKIIATGQKREAKKKGGAATAEDGSEMSENSRDDEQFRARREFLKSGLPEALRRQIAKTTATMEAYAASSSSFQTVAHVQQRDGSSMWSLSSPSCRLLTDLSSPGGRVSDVSQFSLSLGNITGINTKSAVETRPAPVHTQSLFSDVTRERLLAEIRSCNPHFPVRTFYKQFLKKQSDSQSESLTEKCVKPAEETALQEVGIGSKRKRKDSPCTKSKRRKPAESRGEAASPCDSAASAHPSSASRVPRSTRGKNSSDPDVIVVEEQSMPCLAEDSSVEDVLWTEKYQPHSSTEVIGNSAAVRRLHSWLREWKVRAEKEEKRSQKMEAEKDDSWSAGDFHDSEDSDEDSLCNTLLITGPPGVGKTAAVYACAQELGFKVFEVNASCQRSGRQILAQLREATQSHQVDQQGPRAHKPCFFTSASSVRSPRKLNSPKSVVSSPRKLPASPQGSGHRSRLPPKALNFFCKGKPEVKKAISELIRAPQSGPDGKASRAEEEEPQRRTATSLILFEEVDVIFDDDTGFLGAIKTFMSTTKRPVVLTTSDPTFRMTFDGAFEDLSFQAPSVVNVASFLQLLCLAENLRTETKDVVTFLTANSCDVRASVLHLQFWARSGGARGRLPAGDQEAVELPPCHAGCAESLLGIDNIITPSAGVTSYVKERILDPAHWEKILQLLGEFHARNIYFTPSNLEVLLPLPLHVEEPSAPSSCENPEPSPPPVDSLTGDAPIPLSAATKRQRTLPLLDDSDLFESNSLDEILPGSAEETPRTERQDETSRPVRRALSSAELPSALLVCQCLDSMAEFAEHMSFLDGSTCGPADPTHTGRPTWTESRVKHGLCDGLRSDSGDWWSAHSAGDIRALLEALSFQKCSSRMQKSMASSLQLCKRSGKDPTEELTLRVTKAQHQVYFGQPAASTGVAETRLSLVREVMSHRTFISLGSRDVNVTEYLPALRHICRLQRTKEEGKSRRRFLHYLEGIHLELPRATLRALAEDFP